MTLTMHDGSLSLLTLRDFSLVLKGMWFLYPKSGGGSNVKNYGHLVTGSGHLRAGSDTHLSAISKALSSTRFKFKNFNFCVWCHYVITVNIIIGTYVKN